MILVGHSSWNFADKARWLHTYLMTKLNTDLHSKTISIEGKNGFEVYRTICNTIEPIPANYKFFLDSQFTLMPQQYADKVKGLKELYAFRMLLKAKVSAYKKALGEEPDHGQLKQILYVCMDVNAANTSNAAGYHAISPCAEAAQSRRNDGGSDP